MIRKYLVFDLGESLFRGSSVIGLIVSKLPVSVSLGVWSTLIIYLISIPMGIRKAVTHGSMFDVWSSTAIIVGYAIPGFLFAVLLIVVFCGGVYLDWFPLRVLFRIILPPYPGSEDIGLFLAPGTSRYGSGDRRICHPDHADEKCLPG